MHLSGFVNQFQFTAICNPQPILHLKCVPVQRVAFRYCKISIEHFRNIIHLPYLFWNVVRRHPNCYFFDTKRTFYDRDYNFRQLWTKHTPPALSACNPGVVYWYKKTWWAFPFICVGRIIAFRSFSMWLFNSSIPLKFWNILRKSHIESWSVLCPW